MQSKSSSSIRLNNDRPPIPVLTGLRFFAALTVLLAHTLPLIVPKLPHNVTNIIATTSGEGMQLFFVLSGFVIHYNYSHVLFNKGWRGIYNFFVARFARIYPLFIVLVGLELIHLHGYSQLPRDYGHVLPYHLTLIQTWFFKIHNDHNLVYQFQLISQVAWSVSTELFFYISYPVIGFLILKLTSLRSKLSWVVLISCMGFLLVYFISYFENPINDFALKQYGQLAGAFGQHHNFWNQDSFLRWVLYFSPYTRVLEFILGCLTASIYLQLKDKEQTEQEQKNGLFALVASFILLVVAHKLIFFMPNTSFSRWAIYLHCCYGFAPILAAIIFLTARYQNRISQFFSLPVFIKCGEISYSLYLLHLPIAMAFSHNTADVAGFKPNIANLARYCIVLACIFGASDVFYNLIEIPFRRILRKLLSVGPGKESTVRGFVQKEVS